MELKFVDDSEVPLENKLERWSVFLELLKKHPNKWVEHPRRYVSPSTASHRKKKYPDYMFSMKYVEGLDPITNKNYILYVKYVGK